MTNGVDAPDNISRTPCHRGASALASAHALSQTRVASLVGAAR